jgi:hypothetical protein
VSRGQWAAGSGREAVADGQRPADCPPPTADCS